MPICAPQRYLANDRNLLLTATLVPSSVQGVEDQVLEIPLARRGTAEARLTGEYVGAEEATYEVEVTDTIPDAPIVTAPVAAGAGSSRLVEVSATALAAQNIVIECTDAGAPATYAAVSFEGVMLKARAIGVGGNDIRVSVNQIGLTFSPTDFALIADLSAGDGGENNGIEGAGFDWQTAVLGADGQIPLTAKRVAFGDDTSTIYVQYKRYVDNRWTYHFVPALKRAIPKGTPVKFVTGGRTVTVTDGVTPETYPNIATVYDLLIGLRTTSALLDVDGVVANDRSPTGQAVRELLVRTDAHVQPSSGTGGAATGFESAFANSNAQTELVTFTCFANTSKQHPLAGLSKERWEVRSSLGGILGEAVTGEPFVDPSGRWGATVPVKLPAGYGGPRGRFTVSEIDYVSRSDGEPDPPPICVVAKTLGSEAEDQSIELTWTKRPTGDCKCSDLPVPRVGARCLGTITDAEGSDGDDMSYSSEARTRLEELYDWGETLGSAFSRYIEGKQNDNIPTHLIGYSSLPNTPIEGTAISASTSGGGQITAPVPENSVVNAAFESAYAPVLKATGFADDVRGELRSLLDVYEQALAALDQVADTGDRAAGFTKWDDALDVWQADLQDTSGITFERINNFAVNKYRILLAKALVYAGVSPLGKSDASTLVSGDGCWSDVGGTHWFEVVGSKGAYAPAFPNILYYSSRAAEEQGAYYKTREFAFQINIAPECIGRLKEGDRIILSIGDAGYTATYQVGDELTLPVIAAMDLFLAGGRDDNSEQTWSVNGSVFGPFPPWVFTPGDTDSAYSEGGLAFDIEIRGIPNVKGDRFTFSIEGGHYRWRKNDGAWSSPAGISASPVFLDDGLSLSFVPGDAPAFHAGDRYSFRALQPWAVSNLRHPNAARWQWANETGAATLDIDLGSVKAMDTFAIARHTIPAGATLTLAGGDMAANEWTEPVTWREFLTAHVLSQTRSARYLRLSITAGDGGGIGWMNLCEARAMTRAPADVQRRGSFRVLRSDAPMDQGGATQGKSISASVAYPRGGLTDADAQSLDSMVGYIKGNDDQPIILIPHVTRPAEAIIGHVVEDELEFTEMSGQNRNDGAARLYSTQFSLQGVWR